MALRLIEKDVHEKQDQLISLRKQLDEIKSVNIKLQDELKVSILDAKMNKSYSLILYKGKLHFKNLKTGKLGKFIHFSKYFIKLIVQAGCTYV